MLLLLLLFAACFCLGFPALLSPSHQLESLEQLGLLPLQVLNKLRGNVVLRFPRRLGSSRQLRLLVPEGSDANLIGAIDCDSYNRCPTTASEQLD